MLTILNCSLWAVGIVGLSGWHPFGGRDATFARIGTILIWIASPPLVMFLFLIDMSRSMVIIVVPLVVGLNSIAWGYGLSWVWGRIRRMSSFSDRRRMQGLCIHCGYDLRASPDRCPECGTPNSPEAAKRTRTKNIFPARPE